MIVLNVLPPSLKDEFRLARLKSTVKSFAVVVIVLAILGGGMVLAELWTSSLYTAATEEASTAMKSNQDILDFNRKVKRVEAVQVMFGEYSESLALVVNEVPLGVNVKIISVNGEHSRITIEADTEQKDLIFETRDNLQKLDILSDIRLETDELIAKTRKSFIIYANVNASAL